MTEYVTYVTYGSRAADLSQCLVDKYGISAEYAKRIVDEEYRDFHSRAERDQAVTRMVLRAKQRL